MVTPSSSTGFKSIIQREFVSFDYRIIGILIQFLPHFLEEHLQDEAQVDLISGLSFISLCKSKSLQIFWEEISRRYQKFKLPKLRYQSALFSPLEFRPRQQTLIFLKKT